MTTWLLAAVVIAIVVALASWIDDYIAPGGDFEG
jgi:hypothetical protein